MSTWRKKPVEIEAFRWTGGPDQTEDPSWIIDAMMDGGVKVFAGENPHLAIITLEGVMQAEPGDWIIKGIKGELYPCKPDIFEATYEAVV